MELNADFSERVLVHSDEVAWQASPMPGVDRRMLDRIGGEVARRHDHRALCTRQSVFRAYPFGWRGVHRAGRCFSGRTR